MGNDHGDFLVAMDNVLFFCEKLENGSISGTRVPSAAQRFQTYRAADSVCQELRRQGYGRSCVTNAIGEAVDVDVLKNLQGPVFTIRFGPKSYYAGRDRDGKIVSTEYYPVAKKVRYAVALKIAHSLQDLGFESASVYRMKGEFSWEHGLDSDLEAEYREAWGEPTVAK